MANRFYPSISTIVSVDAIPEQLSFIRDGLATILDKIYFRDLQVVKTPTGDSAFYNLKLIFYKGISFNIPGSEIEFALNPNFDATEITEVPISISYEWGILKLINGFNVESFSYNPQDIFSLLTKNILGITPKELCLRVINTFITTSNSSSPVHEFVDKINNKYSSSIPYPTTSNLEVAISQIIATSSMSLQKNTFNIIYEVFIDDINSNIEDNLKNLFIGILGESPTTYIKRLIIPKINASLSMRAGIIFPRNILQPVNANGEILQNDVKSMLLLAESNFSFSSTAGIGFNSEIAATLNHPSMIGNTGLTLSLNTVKVDLSRTRNIPEATADGRSVDFVGVFIREVEIGLPSLFKEDTANPNPPSVKVVGRNLLLGTGGISGSVSLLGSNLNKNFGGGVSASFTSFDIKFQQNAIVSSNIHGTMKIPGFKDTMNNDAEINIDVWIGGNGEFSITASEQQMIQALRMPNIFDLNIKSLSAGKKEGKFYITVSGELDFMDQGGSIGKLLPDKIDIKKLIIWENGKIEFEGGNLLPKNISINLGAVSIAVSNININTYEKEHLSVLRQYHAFEFDGHIKTALGGVDARGDSIKFFYTTDNNPSQGRPPHRYLSIQSINVDIIIPSHANENTASVLLKGYLSIKNPSQGNSSATEYAGNITFSLPKLRIQGAAAMRANPQDNSFIIDASVEMPTPILLGATGLGIYGFRGLIGQKYVVNKGAAGLNQDAKWWEYYKAKIAPENKEGIYVSKFKDTNGFSLGAGVSLATAADGGRTFSSKLFFLLSLPEVFLLQGHGQILKDKVGLDSPNDPPFFAQIAIDSQSIEAAFGVNNYLIPNDKEGGRIAKVSGMAEMGFFFHNSSAWYLNIGRDTPENRRVNVRLLEIFDAYFYLMVSGTGIKAGAGAKYNETREFGPLKAELKAYIDISGKIAFKPKQYGASIQLGGRVGLYLLRFGFSISADASLAAEAPQPFIITGSLKACVRILRKNRCANFEFSWIKNQNLDTSEIEIMDGNKAAMALNMLTSETFPLYNTTSLQQLRPNLLNNYTIPMDSYIDMEFLKSVKPSDIVKQKIGGNTQAVKYIEYVSPQKAKSSQVRHEYTFNEINMYIWSDNEWKSYDIYEAATPLADASFVTTDLTDLKTGYWQYQQPMMHNKLRILAQTPLNFLSQGSGKIIMEELNIDATSIYCPPNPIAKKCVNFESYGQAQIQYQIFDTVPRNSKFSYKELIFRINGDNGIVLDYPSPRYNLNNALYINYGNSLEIIFPHSSSYNQLYLSSTAEYIVVNYYAKKEQEGIGRNNLPQFRYDLIFSKIFHQDELKDTIIYNNIDAAIDKIIITTQDCNISNNDSISNRIDYQRLEAVQNLLNEIITTKYDSESNIIPLSLHEQLEVFSKYAFTKQNEDTNVENISINNINDVSIEIRINYFNKSSKKIRLHSPERLNWDSIQELSDIRHNSDDNSFEITITSDEGKIDGKGETPFPVIQSISPCSFLLYQVCYLKFSEHQHNYTVGNHMTIQNEINTLTEGINKSIQPIWRPNSYYAIEIKTKDTLYKDNTMGEIRTYSNSYVYGFRTTGPIGFFHKENTKYNDLLSKDREAEFKLANLHYYIDFNKSYPNADGHLINAKPLFYIAPELKLSYTQNYVYEFYKKWDIYKNTPATEIELITVIKDPASPDNPLPPITVEWHKNNEPDFRLDINTLNNLTSNSTPCVHTAVLEKIGLHSITSIPRLEPLKLYNAIFKAKSIDIEEDVHNYVFQTSRYGNFKEQINSYILDYDSNNNIKKVAQFEIPLNISSQDLSIANTIINNSLDSNSNLNQEYASNYDKLIYGVFKMHGVHPASTTEFNLLINNTNQFIGLLIRNPEPFNDPKIEDIYLKDTIEVSFNHTNLEQKIFSKDRREVFISNQNFNLTSGNYNFKFTYIKWDGNSYVTEDSISFILELITE